MSSDKLGLRLDTSSNRAGTTRLILSGPSSINVQELTAKVSLSFMISSKTPLLVSSLDVACIFADLQTLVSKRSPRVIRGIVPLRLILTLSRVPLPPSQNPLFDLPTRTFLQ